jgi:hypothetical protein
LKNYDGSLITTEEELVTKWASYFDKLLNCEESRKIFPPSQETRNYQQCLSPSLEEIKCQIQNLKNHKSPGKDEIIAKLIKNGREELIQRIRKIITQVWETEEIPED